jgi:hypothetical protein
MKLTITIELGNEAMQGPRDAAGAILDAFERLGDEPVYAGTIRDENGNTVGSWQVDEDAEESDAQALDTLADYLFTTPEWDGADFCDLAATTIFKTGRKVYMSQGNKQ